MGKGTFFDGIQLFVVELPKTRRPDLVKRTNPCPALRGIFTKNPFPS